MAMMTTIQIPDTTKFLTPALGRMSVLRGGAGPAGAGRIGLVQKIQGASTDSGGDSSTVRLLLPGQEEIYGVRVR